MMGTNPVIGVKPADEYMFRVFTTPVGPYFKGGAKPITIRVSDFDRTAPHGTGHIKAGLNYAMSLHAIVDAPVDILFFHNEPFLRSHIFTVFTSVITVYLFTIVKLLSAKFNGKFPILMKN